MSTRSEFFSNLKPNTVRQYDLPEWETPEPDDKDLIPEFIEVSQFVGGKAIIMPDGEDVNKLIRTIHPEAKHIASNLEGITIANINPDDTDDPHTLSQLDVAIIEGEIGVAENGCVWIPQQVKQKVIYFIAEYLVILLDKKKLVPTMHQAYNYLHDKEYGFGVFISGPSKTADIEQALVVGAHGARGVTVILI